MFILTSCIVCVLMVDSSVVLTSVVVLTVSSVVTVGPCVVEGGMKGFSGGYGSVQTKLERDCIGKIYVKHNKEIMSQAKNKA